MKKPSPKKSTSQKYVPNIMTFFLLVHGGLFVLTGIFLIIVNWLTSPGIWWFVWAIGPWAYAVTLHALFCLVWKVWKKAQKK